VPRRSPKGTSPRNHSPVLGIIPSPGRQLGVAQADLAITEKRKRKPTAEALRTRRNAAESFLPPYLLGALCGPAVSPSLLFAVAEAPQGPPRLICLTSGVPSSQNE
jgi:hypothetical protein